MRTDKKLPIRAGVIAVLEKINDGRSLAALLDDALAAAGDDRAFAHELLLGTLRNWHALARIEESLLAKPNTDAAVSCALRMGMYELLYMKTPEYAAVNETLNALKALQKGYGVAVVNAVLRKIGKSKSKYQKKASKNHSLPNWLAKQIKQDWGQYYDDLGQNLRRAAPVFLRVNARVCSVEEYSRLLDEAKIAHRAVDVGFGDAQAILLLENTPIDRLPKMRDGWVSAQDRHAQAAGHILKAYAPKGARILDACAAPGGKLLHALEARDDYSDAVAVDADDRRLRLVRENLKRHRLENAARVFCMDAADCAFDAPFDFITLDAPCTATGVIRRHPDIALLRKASDVEQTARLQRRILENCWQNLATGGFLLYITCSLLRDENDRQMERFLAANPDACAVDFCLDLPNAKRQTVGCQYLPLQKDDGDGFYYALLQKR